MCEREKESEREGGREGERKRVRGREGGRERKCAGLPQKLSFKPLVNEDRLSQ